MLEYLEDIQKIDKTDSAEIGEQMLLYGIIRSLKPKIVVETGTNRGKTALMMAQALKDNGFGTVYTCDPIDWGQQKTFDAFPELRKHIFFLPTKGTDFRKDDIDLLFIDGFHEKEYPRDEFLHHKKSLTKNAIVIFHDSWITPDNLKHMADVDGAVKELGIKTIMFPTANCMRIYSHGDWHI